MTDLTGDYSGIVINQNTPSTGNFNWRGTYGGNWIYQTFTLPSNYTRGSTDDELENPDLSGFQLFVNIDEGYAQSASLDYTLAYYDGDWVNVASGTQVGSHSDGNCWIDVIFTNSIPVTDLMLRSIFQLGITTRTAHNSGGVDTYAFNQPVTTNSDGTYVINGVGYEANLVFGVPYVITVDTLPAYLLQTNNGVTYSIQMGINTIGYVQPTPLVDSASSHGQAYQTNGLTPLLGTGTTSSLNFRTLGLVVDSGTDFLGNEYRSAVVTAAGTNMDATSETTGSTANTYYQSGPMPSKFAVIPTYWDVRPQATTPALGLINIVSNPSFEYDALNGQPALYSTNDFSSNVSSPAMIVTNAWETTGEQSLSLTAQVTSTGAVTALWQTALLPVTGQQSYYLSCAVDVTNLATGTTACLRIQWFDINGNYISEAVLAGTNSTSVVGVASLYATTVAPYNAKQAILLIGFDGTATAMGTDKAYYDDLLLVASGASVPYFDGDSSGDGWTGQVGHSPSAQLIITDVQDNSIVIDSVLVDPITPNMAFNIYYSIDDTGTSADMTETDWEGKLWTRVPQVYQCTQRQQYALPEPIIAKYVCIEFTNLQAQTYDPGAFAQPVSYLKMPTWVANFFIAEMEQPSFIVDQVNVQYDALDFAYDYYLDDLDESPATPTAAPTDASAQLTSYFTSASSTQGVDATTLSQINLVMNTFAQTPDVNVDSSSILGGYVQTLYNSTASPAATVESSNISQIDYSTVTSLARDQLVFENTLPVMYFFLTCRHAYRTLQAGFDYNRAYFAGVNEISFIRNDYTAAADTSLYIESGGDNQNSELNDWVIESGVWYTYDVN
jgi:hypothetical protein